MEEKDELVVVCPDETKETALPVEPTRKCLDCPVEFSISGGQAGRKRCPDCVRRRTPSPAPRPTPEELIERGIERAARNYAKRVERKKQKEYLYDSPQEPKESEALEILASRKIRSGHVMETIHELALTAAEALHLTPNRFYFQNGVQAMLESQAAHESRPLQEIEDVWQPGERVRLRDLHCLWDYGMSWRKQPDGKFINFEEFRRLRRMCMTDTYEFGRQILNKDFWPEPHGRWSRELFVKKNPDLLPEVYTQEDIKKALAGQSDIHQRILVSSRNSYKSTMNLVDLLGWVLVFGGDIRIFMLSATKPLSSGFLKSFRDYWTLSDPRRPNLFNQLFPEYMIKPDDGKATSFISPMRQLDLIQPTLISSSLESKGLRGERTDLLVAEDCVDESNSGSPEMREKTLELFDGVLCLLEPTGFLQIIGTPFAPGDIYSILFDRETKRDEKLLISQINPCWTVKEGVKKLPYDVTLTADEVNLLFETRLNFKYLKNILIDTPKKFRQEYLCSWVPDAESEIKILFDENTIRNHIKPRSYFEHSRLIETITVMDWSFGTGRWADPSAIVTIEFRQRQQDMKFYGLITDVTVDRLRISELAVAFVEHVRRNNPNRCLVERVGSWESLQKSIRDAAFLRHVSMPFIHWKVPSVGTTTISAKARRIKNLEPALDGDELWILPSAIWNEILITHFTKFDGGPFKRSSQDRHDDVPDAVALAYDLAFPRTAKDTEKTDAQKAAEEEARNDWLLREQYKRVFGTQQVNFQRPEESEDDGNSNPLFRGSGAALRRR